MRLQHFMSEYPQDKLICHAFGRLVMAISFLEFLLVHIILKNREKNTPYHSKETLKENLRKDTQKFSYGLLVKTFINEVGEKAGMTEQKKDALKNEMGRLQVFRNKFVHASWWRVRVTGKELNENTTLISNENGIPDEMIDDENDNKKRNPEIGIIDDADSHLNRDFEHVLNISDRVVSVAYIAGCRVDPSLVFREKFMEWRRECPTGEETQ